MGRSSSKLNPGDRGLANATGLPRPTVNPGNAPVVPVDTLHVEEIAKCGAPDGDRISQHPNQLGANALNLPFV